MRVRRAFPWSDKQHYISIRSSEGKELVLVEDLSSLDAPQRAMLEKWLDDNTFIPRVTRINHVDVRFGFQQWNVQTDRGKADFRVQEREDIRFHPDGRFSIKDADGNMYEMPRLDELDAHSRHAVESLLCIYPLPV